MYVSQQNIREFHRKETYVKNCYMLPLLICFRERKHNTDDRQILHITHFFIFLGLYLTSVYALLNSKSGSLL